MTSKGDNILTEKNTKRNTLLILVIGIWVGIFLVGAAIGVYFVLNRGVIMPAPEDLMVVEIEKEAPVFELEDMQGNLVNLTDLRGQVVVLNFWATWCGPCVEEMPMFERYQAQHPEILLVGVNEEEGNPKVQSFLDKTGFTYLMLLDKHAQAAEQYQIMTLPTSIFIDESGTIRFQHIGYMSETQFDDYLEKMRPNE